MKVLICNICGFADFESEWRIEIRDGVVTRVECPQCDRFTPKPPEVTEQ